jgi:uncharacterized protein YkwD
MLKPLAKIALGFMLLGGGLASCQPFIQSALNGELPETASSKPAHTPLTDPSFLVPLERAVYQRVNQYRQSRQLPPLTLDPYVSQQARIHSESMASGAVPFGHEGLEERLKVIKTAIPWQESAEEIAKNQGYLDPAQEAVEGWIGNADDRRHLEGNFKVTGIGAAKNAAGEYYFTQILLRQPAPVTQAPQTKKNDKNNPVENAFLLALEQKIYQQVNQYRRSRNLPSLNWDEHLSKIARAYSQKMAARKASFSHDGFEDRVKAIAKRIPLQAAGENLATIRGYADPATVAVQGWINSPSHRENMERNFDLTGIGVAKNSAGQYYVTQLFVLER